MLLEFSCSNHKSIKNPIVLSMIAGNDTSFEYNVETINNLKTLKSAVIYGANGSGKSNVIDAISFVKNLVINSINHQPGQGIRQFPHKLNKTYSESSYQIQFISKGTRFVFGFILEKMLVKEEYLYYLTSARIVYTNKCDLFRITPLC